MVPTFSAFTSFFKRPQRDGSVFNWHNVWRMEGRSEHTAFIALSKDNYCVLQSFLKLLPIFLLALAPRLLLSSPPVLSGRLQAFWRVLQNFPQLCDFCLDILYHLQVHISVCGGKSKIVACTGNCHKAFDILFQPCCQASGFSRAARTRKLRFCSTHELEKV